MRIPFAELHTTLQHVLRGRRFTDDRADLCARLFAEASRDGVASHGLNRFPRFVAMIDQGVIDGRAEPEPVAAFGAIERWDGRRGPGNLNAWAMMARAMALARQHGLGGVALRNTNHWMRGGTYGWQAAEQGFVGICWTNTMPNLPPWGSREPRLGNNPLVIAAPRPAGPVVLDMAASQFSYGALDAYARRGDDLPVPGGFDEHGALSHDPAAILASGRPLPAGFWKGSGLALLLDLLAAALADGTPTHRIIPDPLQETGLSQVFLAFDAARLNPNGTRLADEIIAHLQASAPDEQGRPVRYPGERTLQLRRENEAQGVPVDPAVWAEVQGL